MNCLLVAGERVGGGCAVRFYRLYPVAVGIIDEGGCAAANRHTAQPVFAVEGLFVRYAALYPSGHIAVGVIPELLDAIQMCDSVGLHFSGCTVARYTAVFLPITVAVIPFIDQIPHGIIGIGFTVLPTPFLVRLRTDQPAERRGDLPQQPNENRATAGPQQLTEDRAMIRVYMSVSLLFFFHN